MAPWPAASDHAHLLVLVPRSSEGDRRRVFPSRIPEHPSFAPTVNKVLTSALPLEGDPARPGVAYHLDVDVAWRPIAEIASLCPS